MNKICNNYGYRETPSSNVGKPMTELDEKIGKLYGEQALSNAIYLYQQVKDIETEIVETLKDIKNLKSEKEIAIRSIKRCDKIIAALQVFEKNNV